MTSNQIAYYKLMEEKRSNLAKESLTRQANEETQRSNLRKESISSYQANEDARHNIEMEKLQHEGQALNYAASTFATETNYKASIYNAQASMYNAQLNADTQRIASTNAYNASIYASQVTQRGQDVNYAMNANTNAYNYAMNENTTAATTRGQNVSVVNTVLNNINSTINTGISAAANLVGSVGKVLLPGLLK